MVHYIDLSHTISHEMPCYEGDPQVTLEQVSSFEPDGFTDFQLTTGMHSGTHLDGPMHMTHHQTRMAELPLDAFHGTGLLLNVVGQKIIDLPENSFDHLRPGAVVLFYTGFDQYFNQDAYFTSHPVLSEQTAQLLVNKKVKIVGIDCPSPDKAPYPIHSILLENRVLLLENLTNLSALLHVKKIKYMALVRSELIKI